MYLALCLQPLTKLFSGRWFFFFSWTLQKKKKNVERHRVSLPFVTSQFPHYLCLCSSPLPVSPTSCAVTLSSSVHLLRVGVGGSAGCGKGKNKKKQETSEWVIWNDWHSYPLHLVRLITSNQLASGMQTEITLTKIKKTSATLKLYNLSIRQGRSRYK